MSLAPGTETRRRGDEPARHRLRRRDRHAPRDEEPDDDGLEPGIPLGEDMAPELARGLLGVRGSVRLARNIEIDARGEDIIEIVLRTSSGSALRSASSTCVSMSPNVRSLMAASIPGAPSAGSTDAENIACISAGTPGRRKISPPSAAIAPAAHAQADGEPHGILDDLRPDGHSSPDPGTRRASLSPAP